MKLSDIEIGTIVNFLNEGGYVLDFSTADFDAFTYKSIGVPLCETYRLSKGKSLIAYINDAKYEDKINNIEKRKNTKMACCLIYYHLICLPL